MAKLTAPKLTNDCFALPAGVDWTPVDTALSMLRDRLKTVVPEQSCAVSEACSLILARDVVAMRAHPPDANSAVDGYGFAHAALQGDGPYELPLVQGRAAAGVPFSGPVPQGSALRILTGAELPVGVDTVVLEEDVNSDGLAIAFNGSDQSR